MKTDVVIIGGGPAGASAALFLEREGVSSIIVRTDEASPRYHVGESMTGEAGKVIRELGLEAEMVARGYPVKKGVKVYGPKGDKQLVGAGHQSR